MLMLAFFHERVHKYVLAGGIHTLGRDSTNAIVLHEPTASREHVVILGGDKPQIKDLGSRNGTQLDGWPLRAHEWTPLTAGSVIQIGQTSLFVRLAVTEQRDTLPAA